MEENKTLKRDWQILDCIDGYYISLSAEEGESINLKITQEEVELILEKCESVEMIEIPF